MCTVAAKSVLLIVACSLLILLSPPSTASGADCRFNKGGFLEIDGAPRLIIGLYELPKDDAKLGEVAASGFNLIRVPQDMSVLDKVHAHGLGAWICLGSAVQLGDEDTAGRRKLTEVIDQFKRHPALLVWELPDEAVWNIWWRRYAWIASGQQRELRTHIDKVQADTPAETLERWRGLLAQAGNYDGRGLWKQAEALYAQLWSELEVSNPHPAWRMSQCRAECDVLTMATARGCALVRQLDSQHPIWQNHAPRNPVGRLRDYNQMVDAAGCDIYPVPGNYDIGHSDLRNTRLSSVGDYTDRMAEAAPGKSVWMVLQGFGWRDISEGQQDDPDPDKGRRPRWAETRFMAYNALAHGANAVLYWGTHAIEKDSPLWQDLMRIARELRVLEPAIVAPPAQAEPTALADETYGSVDQGPLLMLRQTGDDWVLIAVNEHAQGISFRVTGLPRALEGKRLYRLGSDETQTVRQGGFHDGIDKLGVHVYATSRRFESP